MFFCQNFTNVLKNLVTPIKAFCDPPGGQDPQFEEPCVRLNSAKLPKRLKRTKVYGLLVKSKWYKKILLHCIKH